MYRTRDDNYASGQPLYEMKVAIQLIKVTNSLSYLFLNVAFFWSTCLTQPIKITSWIAYVYYCSNFLIYVIRLDELPERLYYVIADWFRLPFALFVLYVSIVKLRDEIVKWYMVFLYAFFTPYFLVCVILSSLDVYNLYYSNLQFLLER